MSRAIGLAVLALGLGAGAAHAQGAAPYGYAIGKNQGSLKEAVQGAVNALIKDGTYKQVLDKWGLGDGAITESKINAASQG